MTVVLPLIPVDVRGAVFRPLNYWTYVGKI